MQQNTQNIYGSFGIFRFILASLVVLGHTNMPAHMPLARYAVYGFFVVSGYTIAFILNENYYKQDNSFAKYISNRWLRIYPLYYVALLLMFFLAPNFLAIRAGQGLQQYVSNGRFFEYISDALVMIQNLTLIGLNNASGDHSTILPIAWSLSNEVYFYILLFFILKNRYLLFIFFSIGFFWTLIMYFSPSASLRYYSPFSAILPYTLGAYAYLKRGYILKNIRLLKSSYIFFGCIITYLLCLTLKNKTAPIAVFYLMIFINFLICLKLQDLKFDRLKHLDKFLGNISYPLFIFHEPLWVLQSTYLPLEYHNTYLAFFLLWFCAILLAIFIHFVFERRINILRDRIRGFKISLA